MRDLRLGLIVLSLSCASCDVDEFLGVRGGGQAGEGIDLDADDEESLSPENQEHARLAGEFSQALVKGEFAAAHALGSSHLKSRMTVEQLAEAEQKSYKEYGKPLRVKLKSASVNTKTEELAGPNRNVPGEDAVDRGIRKLSATRAVGDMPDSIPAGIRKASVVFDVRRDPRTIPDDKKKSGMKFEDMREDDMPLSYLTVVLVEENGKLGVAHYFYRWHDVWD